MRVPRWFRILFIVIGIGLVIIGFVFAGGGDVGIIDALLADFRWGIAIVAGLILVGIALYFTYKEPRDDRHDPDFHPEKKEQKPEKWE